MLSSMEQQDFYILNISETSTTREKSYRKNRKGSRIVIVMDAENVSSHCSMEMSPFML